jgi:hypothetical protein
LYWAGTSNATALTSRAAAQLHDVLAALRDQGQAEFLMDQGIFVAALKALLVHGADLGEGLTIMTAAFSGRVDNRRLREFTSRFLGYGRVDLDRAFGSTAQRATLIGGGHLHAEDADVFEIPLPPSLSGKTGRRRLTMTLAWLSPVNSRDRRYRRARLWFAPPRDELQVDRCQADWNAAQRGTIQHEILEGRKAAVFADGEALTVQVNCAAYAGALTDAVPYSLAVSLEAAPELDVPVFAEVRERIRPLVTVRPT